MRRKTKEGTARRNKYGEIMFVERYNTKNNVWVRFRNNYRVCTTWWRFSTGNVKSPYDKNIYGIGYFGFGKYKPYINGKKTNCYNTWHSIFTRCYSQKVHEKYPTYKDCQVCEEWLNFQNFSEWYDRNYYEIDGEKMCLDKDILVKGNKIYSPETCIFVPERINSLFTKANANRGKYPIGVFYDNNKNKFIACGSVKERHKYLGKFDTPKEAFNAYKKFKEKIIKQVAEDYKEKIPEKLYNLLITYKVEIDD